jgi:hypothetical protein
MSIGNWMYRAAAGGLLAANLCCGLSADTLAQGEGNNPGRQERPADQERKPEPANDPVTLRAVQDAINRIAGAIEAQKDEADTKRKDEREESDLKAQWEMARWAENMLWAALGSLAVTAVGVFLVARTLIYSRDAARAAREMVVQAEATTKAAIDAAAASIKGAKAAEDALQVNRAWVCSDGYAPGTFINGTSGGKLIKNGLVFHLKWKNLGATPALDVNLYVAHMLVLRGTSPPFFPYPSNIGDSSATIGPGTVFNSPWQTLDDAATEKLRSSKCVLFLYSRVTYRDIYKRDLRVSEVCMLIEMSGGQTMNSKGELVDHMEATPVGPQNSAT